MKERRFGSVNRVATTQLHLPATVDSSAHRFTVMILIGNWLIAEAPILLPMPAW